MDASELIKAKVADQKAIASGDKTKIKKIFEANAKLLKKFVRKNGWPSKERHGTERCFAAWLIAQHADHDPEFQLRCLAMMIDSYLRDKYLTQNVAFLLDRVLVNFGQKQIFGTQLNGKFVVPRTMSPKEIDFLRGKIRLEPIKDYVARVKMFAEKQAA